jgi:signal transduction histidine kinase
LLDINMPDMGGYEVCEQLKTDADLRDIPVIFLSALQETSDKVKAFEAGGVDYIAKPFQAAEVLSRVRTHLELRSQKRRLQENVEALIKLERLREILTHMIVHDMRSPLETILGYLELLATHEVSNLSANGLSFIGEARRSIEWLIDTVNSMLDLSKLEAGELRLNRSECDLGDIAGSLLSGFESLRGARRWTLDAPAQPVKLSADPRLISRVIQNLIGNSIKFTPNDGCIKMKISVTDNEARFAISDDGCGVVPRDQERIFEKFGQVESVDTRVGTGLGLFFCHLAVKLHGGHIGVQSEAGKGSTFWFTLPL